MHPALIVTLVAAGTIVFASTIEGLFHQFILHTRQKKLLGGLLEQSYVSHAIEHHPAYRGDDYHRPAPDHESPISLGPWMWPATMLVTSPITALVWLTLGPAAGITVPIVLTLYYVMYEFLHWHMHFPREDGKPRWYHAFPPTKQLFEWFDVRHFLHHQADDRNFNVVLPVYDLMTGRYTTRETEVPWAIRARKARAIRKSEAIRRQRVREDEREEEKVG